MGIEDSTKLVRRLRFHALPDPDDGEAPLYASLMREAAGRIEALERLVADLRVEEGMATDSLKETREQRDLALASLRLIRHMRGEDAYIRATANEILTKPWARSG